MTPQPAEKKFDCVDMMHRGAARVHAELEGKSREEQAAYWRDATAALLERQAKLRGTKNHAPQQS